MGNLGFDCEDSLLKKEWFSCKYMKNNHTFVVLAYRESEYLEECIKSVMNQTASGEVVLATSTRNEFIEDIARKYDLEIIENKNLEKGIAQDFEFALSCVDSKFVTIAHQDDVYDKTYLENILRNLDQKTVIALADYFELRDSGIEKINTNLFIKRMLLLPLKFKTLQASRFIKRACLSFGNPICCPAVTFNKSLIKENVFVSNFRSNMDWYAWEKLSKIEGKFSYINKPLILHRIHADSVTSEVINEQKRTNEDYEMFKLFWPEPIARIITKVYRKSEKNNG